MKHILFYVPELYLEGLDDLVRGKMYPNRNEAIRFAVRDLLQDRSQVLIGYMKRGAMKPITVNIPEPYVQGLDDLVRGGKYSNRSDAIRSAIGVLLYKELRVLKK